MEALQTVHGEARWLLLLLGTAAVLALLLALLRKRPFGRHHRVLLLAYLIALDLYLVLGMALLVLQAGGPLAPRLVHAGVLLLAALAAHATAAWREGADARRLQRHNLSALLASLLVVFLAGA